MGAPATITVDRTFRGNWEVVLPGGCGYEVCRTFEDALRVGYRHACEEEECDLVVRDAYHRLLRLEHLGAAADN